jgi:60 kDa SS-A/Ro ribonucleoprotein
MRKAVARWYESKNAGQLGYQLIKYRQRDGWTHRDVLRLAHPEPSDEDHKRLYAYVTGNDPTPGATRENFKDGDVRRDVNFNLPRVVLGYEQAQRAETPAQTAALVREYRLPREALQTEHLNDPDVWMAMLDEGMPLTAMIRNLGTMTRNGVFGRAEAVNHVLGALRDQDRILEARVHPIAVLGAHATYNSGGGFRSRNVWTPVRNIVEALEGAFYLAFGNVEPTGQRRLIALDVSGSMTFSELAGVPGLTPRVGSAALALISLATGDETEIVAFAADHDRGSYWGYYNPLSLKDAGLAPTRVKGIAHFPIERNENLQRLLGRMDNLPFGGTDCALPMVYALRERKEFDVFEVYTDSETWAGGIHPAQALYRYREQTNIPAKLVVVGMVSNGFSIADPRDPGMLDVVGFDTATPNIISEFSQGRL